MTSCRTCGEEIQPQTRFCPACGEVIVNHILSHESGSESVLRSSLVPVSGTDEKRDWSGPTLRVLDELAEYIGPVTARLLDSHRAQPTVLYAINMGDYMMGAVIPQISCEAVGGVAHEALDLAYAYSLGLIAGRLTDDMMDRTIERRGKRTVWREFGDPVAFPMGFQLISEMFEVLSAYDTTLGRLASDRISRTFRLALVESARAEEQEKLARRSNAGMTFRERVTLARGKRGTLIAAGTTSGAIVGGGTEAEIQLLKDYGTFMGTANQLFDDSNDPDYPQSYRDDALSECRDLTAEAVKCTDKLRQTEAQRRLRDISKMAEVPLL